MFCLYTKCWNMVKNLKTGKTVPNLKGLYMLYGAIYSITNWTKNKAQPSAMYLIKNIFKSTGFLSALEIEYFFSWCWCSLGFQLWYSGHRPLHQKIFIHGKSVKDRMYYDWWKNSDNEIQCFIKMSVIYKWTLEKNIPLVEYFS